MDVFKPSDERLNNVVKNEKIPNNLLCFIRNLQKRLESTKNWGRKYLKL